MRSKLLLAFVAAMTMTFLLAADFWETKEFTSWTEKECKKLLTKSPWAFSNGFRTVANLGSPTTGERETALIVEFRLLTAKPVRMALAQLQLLQKPGDQALREQVEKYVDQEPGDQIIVQISYRTTTPSYGELQDLRTFFGRASLATFHGNTYLSAGRDLTVPISGYLQWNSERPNPAFIFPRYKENGEPYFTGTEKEITLRSEIKLESVTIGRAPLPSSPGDTEPALGGTLSVLPKNMKFFVKMKPKDMQFKGEFAL